MSLKDYLNEQYPSITEIARDFELYNLRLKGTYYTATMPNGAKIWFSLVTKECGYI
jgi:hypothetical protein